MLVLPRPVGSTIKVFLLTAVPTIVC